MTDTIDTAKADWVRRVLGISPGTSTDTPSTGFPKQWQAALQAWETAMDEVNAQIEKLGQALRASDNKTLQDIAEFGLNAVTGNHLVPVRAALLEVARAGEQIPAALRDKTVDLVDDFEDHLGKDIRVALTQSNPFKIPVPIANRLVPAVSALGKVLATA